MESPEWYSVELCELSYMKEYPNLNCIKLQICFVRYSPHSSEEAQPVCSKERGEMKAISNIKAIF